ncbi:uncharacterized protein JCM10292_002463 [Rhodotorula paludigena]|uniref:uncharacterized protein n=1 Tax=Rhodotorula paludigena TaxID=86838 RepID=UPI00316CE09D
MSVPSVAPLDASKLRIELTPSPKDLPHPSTLVFGQTFTDHMLTAKWNIQTGWADPVIQPYGPLALDPSSTVLHYAPTLFEGMKAYVDKQGRTRLFRPDLNMARLNRGAARLAFPTLDGETLTELIKELLRVDQRWIPTAEGCSLYIRPTMIGTRASLGVGPSTEVLLFVILSPVAKYYASGAKPVSLLGSTKDVRAWPKGTGSYKFGLNYGACVQPQLEAAQQGYQQVLWLYGDDDEVTEVGMMNFWGAKKGANGVVELFTPPLGDIILPGVTRDSVLALARAHADPSHPFRLAGLPDELVVSERKVTMPELRDAARDGSLLEVFGTGTAAIVTSVERIGYCDEDVVVPVEGGSTGGFGRIAEAFYDVLQAIQYGDAEHEGWSVLV